MIFICEVVMKKKKITRFPICRKGYDIDAVESYIALEGAKCDEAQQLQRERISALKSECDKLRTRIGELEGREEQIKTALVTATQNADKLTEDVKARYCAELERLRLFRTKWVGAYEQMKERYHFDKDALNVESVAVNIEVELTKFLMQDFSLNKAVCEDEMEAHFRREIERLTRPVLRDGASSLSEDVTALKQKIQFDGVDASSSKYGGNLREKDCIGSSKTDADLQSKDVGVATHKRKAETQGKIANDNVQNSVAFSLEEALNPTISLDQNCQALGLVR